MLRPPTHSEQDVPAPSPLVEELLTVLEKYGVPQGLNDSLVYIVELWEADQERISNVCPQSEGD